MGAPGPNPPEPVPSHPRTPLWACEATFQKAFASANTGMCLVSTEGRLLEVNGRLCDIFGYGKSELEQMSVNDLALDDDRDLSPHYIHQALEGGDAGAVFEKRYRHRDGSIVHAVVSSSLVRDDQGQPLYFISLVQDISERKRQEAVLKLQRQQLGDANRFLAEARDALARDRARLAAILDALLDPHLLLEPVRDGEGGIVDVRCLEANAAACADSRRALEQLQGSSLRRLLPSVPPSAWLEPCRAVIETGRPLVLDDIADTHRHDGTERRLDIRVVKVGEALSVSWRDVTERWRAAQRLATSEQHYRLLAENSGEVVLLLSEEGRVRWVSPALRGALGWDPEDWIGQLGRDLLSHRGEDLQAGASGTQLRNGQTVLTRQQARARDGALHWLEIHLSPYRRSEATIDGVVAIFRTIDEEVAAERVLRLSEERHRLLAENARDVIWTMAPDGMITSVSQAVESLRGLTPEEAMAQPIEQIHPPASLAISRGYFSQLADDLQAGRPLPSFRGELEYFCRDGSTVWMDVMALPVLDEQGQFMELLGVSRDITERKRTALELQQAREAAETANRALQIANRKLGRLATTDGLTGLWNRRALDELVRREILRVDRYGDALSMVLFDIDHFKTVNDRFGHLAGDHVLVELGRRVKAQLRDCDGLGRWGGEEFLVLLPHSSGQEARQLAERLRRLVEAEPFEAVGSVTISAGVAQRRPRESAEDWFRRLDRVMYRAKERGRNRVELEPELAPESGACAPIASPL